jgi:predicted metal-dependent hydrolase
MNQSLVSDLKRLEVAEVSVPLNLFRLRVVRLEGEYSEELGVACKQIRLKSLRSRWGSCTRLGVITINLRLKSLPPEFLEYVVFHECLHLRYKNHGREFRASLQNKFPHWRLLNKQLKVFGSTFLR